MADSSLSNIPLTIRTYRPEAVLVGTWEVEFVVGLNQSDHRVAGLAALDAVRDAANRWVFPELLDDGLAPWSVRWLLVAGDPRPTHGVDVTGDAVGRGIASLEAHREYLAGIPGHPPAGAMISGNALIKDHQINGGQHATRSPDAGAAGLPGASGVRVFEGPAAAGLGADGHLSEGSPLKRAPGPDAGVNFDELCRAAGCEALRE